MTHEARPSNNADAGRKLSEGLGVCPNCGSAKPPNVSVSMKPSSAFLGRVPHWNWTCKACEMSVESEDKQQIVQFWRTGSGELYLDVRRPHNVPDVSGGRACEPSA